MFTPDSKPRECHVKSEKEVLWDDAKNEVDKITDDLGRGVDEGIKEAVIAFKVNGFPLSSSCEGHVDSGIPVPYVEISAPNEPEEKFVGQNEAFEKTAKKYGISAKDAKRGRNLEAYWEARDEAGKNRETEEYEKWDEENKRLRIAAKNLLAEFYKNRKAKLNVKLKINEIEGGFRIHNGGEDYDDVFDGEKEISDREKEERAEKVEAYRKEMDDFAEFLKQRFFTGKTK